MPPLFAASVFEVGVTCRQLSADKPLKIKAGRGDIALPLLTIEREGVDKDRQRVFVLCFKDKPVSLRHKVKVNKLNFPTSRIDEKRDLDLENYI